MRQSLHYLLKGQVIYAMGVYCVVRDVAEMDHLAGYYWKFINLEFVTPEGGFCMCKQVFGRLYSVNGGGVLVEFCIVPVVVPVI